MSLILLDGDFDTAGTGGGPPVPIGPVPPMLGYLGSHVLGGMAPNWQAADPENAYALAWFVYAVAFRAEPVIGLFRDSESGPGWSALLDIDRCPEDWLDYLGQFLGVSPSSQISPPLTDSAKRARIEMAEGFWRGTIGDLRAKAQRHLTGSKRCDIFQFYEGNPFKIRVVTFEAETPDPDVTLADLLPVPAGFLLTYQVFPGESYAELEAGYGPDYVDIATAFATYEGILTNIPGT